MPNNPISTPLPADLPVNWQTGQIVAPNGADVGLSPQHGYNYLMQQLNAAQQAGNTLGAAIAALKGSDIPTSGSDSTDLATALSNKAEKGTPQQYDLPYATNFGTVPGYQSTYSKDQFGMVTVNIACYRTDGGTIKSGSVIATIPAGFRPNANVGQSVAEAISAIRSGNGFLDFSPDGSIMFTTIDTGVTNFVCSLSYLAQG